MRRRTAEFARTRNPSCRVPCRGVLAGKKSSRYISVAQTTENETPSLKIKKFGESDGKPATEKALRYIHVTRTCQNAHPFENFTFCKRLVRGIHSPGNALRSFACTRLYEQRSAGKRNSASGPQTSLNRYKRRFRQGVHDRKPPKDTVCDTSGIQSQMRGQAIAAHGYPALCSFQRVVQYIGPPFRDREKDCRKSCEQGNKKEPHEQRLRENPNTCSHGPGSLSFGKPAPDHSLFAIQLWIVCWL